MRLRIILTATVVLFACATAAAAAEEVSRGAEFFYYDETPGNDGRTDFFTGGAEGWGVDNRIDYLKNYAAFLKMYNGGLKLDEYSTAMDEVEEKIRNLKPQPVSEVRRTRWLETWRWALSDSGEKDGWTAPGFDDSGWNSTEKLPLVIKGNEERDLWMRTSVRTGGYEKAFIEFDSVLGDSEIWVNGAKVAGPDAFHNDSAPFRVDLTSWLEKNADNSIVIHVRDHKERGESGSPGEPSKLIGWGAPGRIYLIETRATVIDNVFVYTQRLGPGPARLKIQFTLLNYLNTEFEGTAEVAIRKWFPDESGTPAAAAVFPISVMAGSGTDSPAHYALDFGAEDSPVAPGFEKVTPDTVYDPERGFGWDGAKGLSAADSDAVPLVEYLDADLKRDAIEGNRPSSFKLKTGAGLWTFSFTIGSPDRNADTIIKYIDDNIVEFGKGGLDRFEFAPVHVTQFIRGDVATLKFSPREKGQVFTINGITAMNHVPRTQRFEKSIAVESPAPWSPESPNLYELRLALKNAAGETVDDVAVTFGIVTLEDRDGDLYVNGARYRLRGVLETHSFPPERDDDLTCIAPPDRWIVQDIADNRKANCNVMRFHPAEGLGTNYLRWLEYADQMGMFVFWSPREWFHWGNRATSEYMPPLAAHLEPSMVAARNHPSIFAWEGGNETYYNNGEWDDRAKSFSDDYYYMANSIDPSRFILPISFWYAQFEGKADFYRIDLNRGNELTYPGSGRSPLAFWAPNVFWDVHPYPGWYGGWAEIWWGAGGGDKYKKDKIYMVSEFGAEGMPNWDLYKDESYYHVWEESASSAAKHEKNRLGRNLGLDEWEISQAYQALVMHNDIASFRTEDADGVMICTGAEGRHNGRYYKGIRDMHRRPKLAYYATRDAYRDVFVEGLNGDMVLSGADALKPVIVNEGPARAVDIEFVFRDMRGEIAYRETIENIELPETGNLRLERGIGPLNLASGSYYYVEYVVMDR